jgi:hypothetical protein
MPDEIVAIPVVSSGEVTLTHAADTTRVVVREDFIQVDNTSTTTAVENTSNECDTTEIVREGFVRCGVSYARFFEDGVGDIFKVYETASE